MVLPREAASDDEYLSNEERPENPVDSEESSGEDSDFDDAKAEGRDGQPQDSKTDDPPGEQAKEEEEEQEEHDDHEGADEDESQDVDDEDDDKEEEEPSTGARGKASKEPYDVPTTGAFYMHDDRFNDEEFEEQERMRQQVRAKKKQLWAPAEDKWEHDRFHELDEPYDPEQNAYRGSFGGSGHGRGRRPGRGSGRGRGRGQRVAQDPEYAASGDEADDANGALHSLQTRREAGQKDSRRRPPQEQDTELQSGSRERPGRADGRGRGRGPGARGDGPRSEVQRGEGRRREGFQEDGPRGEGIRREGLRGARAPGRGGRGEGRERGREGRGRGSREGPPREQRRDAGQDGSKQAFAAEDFPALPGSKAVPIQSTAARLANGTAGSGAASAAGTGGRTVADGRKTTDASGRAAPSTGYAAVEAPPGFERVPRNNNRAPAAAPVSEASTRAPVNPLPPKRVDNVPKATASVAVARSSAHPAAQQQPLTATAQSPGQQHAIILKGPIATYPAPNTTQPASTSAQQAPAVVAGRPARSSTPLNVDAPDYRPQQQQPQPVQQQQQQAIAPQQAQTLAAWMAAMGPGAPGPAPPILQQLQQQQPVPGSIVQGIPQQQPQQYVVGYGYGAGAQAPAMEYTQGNWIAPPQGPSQLVGYPQPPPPGVQYAQGQPPLLVQGVPYDPSGQLPPQVPMHLIPQGQQLGMQGISNPGHPTQLPGASYISAPQLPPPGPTMTAMQAINYPAGVQGLPGPAQGPPSQSVVQQPYFPPRPPAPAPKRPVSIRPPPGRENEGSNPGQQAAPPAAAAPPKGSSRRFSNVAGM